MDEIQVSGEYNDNEEKADDDSLSKKEPPKNVEAWCKMRYNHTVEIMECFDTDTIGNETIGEDAIAIVDRMLVFCTHFMGPMYDEHVRRGTKYACGTPFEHIENRKDPFKDWYHVLASPSAWACFALQQAFFRSSVFRGTCDTQEAAECWHIRSLHAALCKYKSQSFTTYDGVSDQSQHAHTLVGSNIRSLRGISNQVNKQAIGAVRRRLRIDSLGEDDILMHKADCFKKIYEWTFGTDDEFAPYICNLGKPKVHNITASNSLMHIAKAMRASKWNSRSQAEKSSRQAKESKPPSALSELLSRAYPKTTTKQPERRLVPSYVMRRQKAAQSDARARLAERHAEEERDVLECIERGNLRDMACTDLSNEKVEAAIAKASQNERKRREDVQRTTEATEKTAVENESKMDAWQKRKDKKQAEFEAAIQARDKVIERLQEIRRKVMYSFEDDDHDPSLDGTEIPGAVNRLSKEERKIYDAGVPAEMCFTDYFRESMPIAKSPEVPKLTKLQAKMPPPGEMIDYATIFGCETETDLGQSIAIIDRNRARAKGDPTQNASIADEYASIAPWIKWLHHMTKGSDSSYPSRMVTDLREHKVKFSRALNKQRGLYVEPPKRRPDGTLDIDAEMKYRRRLQSIRETEELRQQKAEARENKKRKKIADDLAAKQQKEAERKRKREEKEAAESERKRSKKVAEAQRQEEKEKREALMHAQKQERAQRVIEKSDEKEAALSMKPPPKSGKAVFLQKPVLGANGLIDRSKLVIHKIHETGAHLTMLPIQAPGPGVKAPVFRLRGYSMQPTQGVLVRLPDNNNNLALMRVGESDEERKKIRADVEAPEYQIMPGPHGRPLYIEVGWNILKAESEEWKRHHAQMKLDRQIFNYHIGIREFKYI